jgi:hypothetical protein
MIKQIRMVVRRISDDEILKIKDLVNSELDRRKKNLEKQVYQ